MFLIYKGLLRMTQERGERKRCSNKVLVTDKKSYCSFWKLFFALFSMYQRFTGFWKLVSDTSISANCFVVVSLRFQNLENNPKKNLLLISIRYVSCYFLVLFAQISI